MLIIFPLNTDANASECPKGQLELGYGEEKAGIYLDCRLLHQNKFFSNVEVYFNLSYKGISTPLAYKKFDRDTTQATFKHSDLSEGLANTEVIHHFPYPFRDFYLFLVIRSALSYIKFFKHITVKNMTL